MGVSLVKVTLDGASIQVGLQGVDSVLHAAELARGLAEVDRALHALLNRSVRGKGRRTAGASSSASNGVCAAEAQRDHWQRLGCRDARVPPGGSCFRDPPPRFQLLHLPCGP